MATPSPEAAEAPATKVSEPAACGEKRDAPEKEKLSEWQETQQRQQVELSSLDASLKKEGILPEVSITSDAPDQRLMKIVGSDQTSASEKLKAVEELGKQGVTSFSFQDIDGQRRTVRVELEPAGNRQMVHLYATDDSGRERIVLRGISNGDGTFSREKNSRGNEVSFYGAWWETNMNRRSQLGQASDNEADEFWDARGEDVQTRLRQMLQQQTVWSEWQKTQDPSQPQLSAEQMNMTDPRVVNYLFDKATQAKSGRAKRMEILPGGLVYFRSGMQVDADGSPRARQIDPCGQTETSLRHPGGASVNAEQIPYFVLPGGSYKHLGIKLGDIAAVRYQGKVQFAVFADVGPSYKIGEGSMALAQALGINPSPTRGGTSSPQVEYLVFRGSGDRTPGHPVLNNRKGIALLNAYARQPAYAG